MLHFLAQRWFLGALVAGVAFSLFFPNALHPWLAHVPPDYVIAGSLFLMAWTMPTRTLTAELRRPGAALWAMAMSYGLLPAAAALVGDLAPLADVRVGLLLAASVPCTLASCVLWTRLAGGNEATALLTVLGCTLTSWFLTTFWLALTTGAQIEIPIVSMMLDLTRTLIVPVAAGQGLRWSVRAREFANRHKTALGALAQCFVLLIVLKAAAAVGTKIHETDLRLGPLALSALLAFGLHLFALYAGLWSSTVWGLDRPRAIAVAFAGSQKTLPISLLLFDKYFKDEFPLAVVPLLFFHVGQLLLDTLIAERLRHAPIAVETAEAL